AVVLVGVTGVDEPSSFLLAALHPVELKAQGVPVEPEPRERALDLLGRALDLAAHVRVLDAQQARAALLAREEPVEEERPRRPDGEGPGWGRRHSGQDGPGGRLLEAGCSLVLIARVAGGSPRRLTGPGRWGAEPGRSSPRARAPGVPRITARRGSR